MSVAGQWHSFEPSGDRLLATLAMEAVPCDRLLRRPQSPGKPGSQRVLHTHLKCLRRDLGGGRDRAGTTSRASPEDRRGIVPFPQAPHDEPRCCFVLSMEPVRCDDEGDN